MFDKDAKHDDTRDRLHEEKGRLEEKFDQAKDSFGEKIEDMKDRSDHDSTNEHNRDSSHLL